MRGGEGSQCPSTTLSESHGHWSVRHGYQTTDIKAPLSVEHETILDLNLISLERKAKQIMIIIDPLVDLKSNSIVYRNAKLWNIII